MSSNLTFFNLLNFYTAFITIFRDLLVQHWVGSWCNILLPFILSISHFFFSPNPLSLILYILVLLSVFLFFSFFRSAFFSFSLFTCHISSVASFSPFLFTSLSFPYFINFPSHIFHYSAPLFAPSSLPFVKSYVVVLSRSLVVPCYITISNAMLLSGPGVHTESIVKLIN